MQTVDIYIDTGIKGPKPRQGSYMYIVAMETNKGTADIGNMKTLPETTENGATLAALEEALKRIAKPCKLVIHLECNYVATAFQRDWISQWKNNDWKNARGKPVADAEKWRSIEYLLNAHEFSVCYKEPHTYREWMQRELGGKEQKNP